MNAKTALFLFVAILLLGLVLRLHQVDKESFWTDEILTVRHAQEDSPAKVIENVSQREGAPFGHYLLLHYWIKIFGVTELATRLLSVVFGVLSIAVLFLIADTLFNKKVALISSLFLATSMLQILYSQEVRLYAMFTFLSLSATYFFIEIYRWELPGPNNRKTMIWYIFYAIGILASIYTNYLTVFIVLGYTFVLLWNWEKTKHFFPRWVAVNSIILLLSLPLIPMILTQFNSIGNNAKVTFTGFGVPAFIAQLGLFMFALPMFFLIAILTAALLCRRKIKFRFGSECLPSALFLPIVILFSAAYMYVVFSPFAVWGITVLRVPITHSYFLIRHTFFIAPLLYIFLAYYIGKMPKKVSAAALCILLFMNIFALTAYYSETTKAEWHEAAAYIQEHAGNRPLILLDRGGSTNAYLLTYYFDREPRIIKLTKSPRGQQLWKIKPQNLFETLEEEQTFWLILSGNGETEDYYKNLLRSQYRLVTSKEFYNVAAYKFQK